MKKLSLVILALALSPCAHAYIDPGTGSFMLQMLIASVIGAGLTVKLYYQNLKVKLKSLFSNKSKPKNEHEKS